MKILIIGATSAIAHETAKLFANDAAQLVLVGRDQHKLRTLGDDLRVRGARVEEHALDLCQLDRHEHLVNEALSALGSIDAVLIAHGTLSDQQACERDVGETVREMTTNSLSTISLLTLLANRFEQQGYGCIAVISSVAGDRGRQSNYVYGAAKGSVTIFLQGLRNRLAKSNVSVVTVKPGFVDTPMTADIPKNALFASPEAVARQIYHCMQQPRDVMYTPWFWWPVMSVIRAIPERVFKRLSL